MARHKKKNKGVGLMCLLTVCATLLLCAGGYLAVSLFQGDAAPSAILMEKQNRDIVSLPPMTLKPARTPELTPEPTPEPVRTEKPTPEPMPSPAPDVDVTLRFVGDIMCHDRQIRAAEREGSYDMSDWFSTIAPSIQGADLAVGNLETTFAGAEKGYGGFPHFNTPDEYADALKEAGFDVLTTANNHTYDFRLGGIERTLRVLDDRGIAHTGAYAREEDYDCQLIVDVKGVKVGILAYTDTFNRKPKEEWCVRELSEKQVKKDVAAMREQGADLIVCMVHWGSEYEEHVGSSQEKRARILAENGVDAIFGSHPHVIQTAEMLSVETDAGIKTVPVAYSMGNFISNQQNRPCDMGVIFEITAHKSGETGETAVTGASFVPTVVYRGHSGHRDTYEVLPCGIYKEKSDHPKRHRCETVWEHEVNLMGAGFTALAE